MVARLRACAFAVRVVLASATLTRWLRWCKRRWYALFLVWYLLSSSFVCTSSAESLFVYRWLDTVDGRGASLNSERSVLLRVYRFCCFGFRVCSGRPCIPGYGSVGGLCLFVGSGFGWWYCLRFESCSRALGGLLGGLGVVILMVSRSLVFRFVWVYHTFAFLKSSVSCTFSGGGGWVSAQYVCLAVSSIPVWSALAGPYLLGVSLVIFHTVIVAGVWFSGTSSCGQGPLNRFCFSLVRIRSLLEVISMSPVVGQVALNSLRCCVRFLFSS